MMKLWLSCLWLLFTVYVNGQTFDINNKPPSIEYVSVHKDNSVFIQWKPSISLEAIAYKIMVIIRPDGYIVDSVSSSITSATLTQPLVNTPWGNQLLPQVNNQAVRFQVVGYDMNNNPSSKGFNDTQHQTVFLKTKFDSCNSRVILTWTNYIGWGESLKEYYLGVDSTGSDFRMNTPFSKSDTVQSFPVSRNKTYIFHITAVNNNGLSSSSNFVPVSTKMSPIPAILDAKSASFLTGSNQIVQLQFTLDPIAALHQYELYASSQPNANFSKIRTFTNITGSSLTTTDTLKTPSPQYYLLKVDDMCGDTVKTSNLATAVVPAYKVINNNVNLTWNPYVTWPGTVTYDVFRSIGNNPLETIGSGITNTDFSDDIQSMIKQQLSGDICYYVEAINAITNDRARSASVCIDLTGEIFVPEAFTPNGDGINDEFMPSFAFLPNTNDYHLIIYSRYGSKIFESTDPLKGWNGKMGSGARAPAGEYPYFISFSTSSGKKVIRNGAFSLIYPQ